MCVAAEMFSETRTRCGVVWGGGWGGGDGVVIAVNVDAFAGEPFLSARVGSSSLCQRTLRQHLPYRWSTQLRVQSLEAVMDANSASGVQGHFEVADRSHRQDRVLLVSLQELYSQELGHQNGANINTKYRLVPVYELMAVEVGEDKPWPLQGIGQTGCEAMRIMCQKRPIRVVRFPMFYRVLKKWTSVLGPNNKDVFVYVTSQNPEQMEHF